MDIVCLHVIVEGYVQGVGFRYYVNDIASELGIFGWVRNRWDGSVEVLVEGNRTDLEKLLSALYQGPRNAEVRGVKPEWQTATGEFKDFTIRRTAM
jgi:acylphosphatase